MEEKAARHCRAIAWSVLHERRIGPHTKQSRLRWLGGTPSFRTAIPLRMASRAVQRRHILSRGAASCLPQAPVPALRVMQRGTSAPASVAWCAVFADAHPRGGEDIQRPSSGM